MIESTHLLIATMTMERWATLREESRRLVADNRQAVVASGAVLREALDALERAGQTRRAALLALELARTGGVEGGESGDRDRRVAIMRIPFIDPSPQPTHSRSWDE